MSRIAMKRPRDIMVNPSQDPCRPAAVAIEEPPRDWLGSRCWKVLKKTASRRGTRKTLAARTTNPDNADALRAGAPAKHPQTTARYGRFTSLTAPANAFGAS